jgi:hypothetical protein
MTATDWLIVGGVVVGTAIGITLIAASLALAAGWVPNVPAPDYSKGVTTTDLGSLAVAGGTALLAAFTALLAFTTRRSIDATQREADIAADALRASNRQAEAAESAMKAAKDQVAIAKDQLAASIRPQIAAPRLIEALNIQPSVTESFRVILNPVNLGPGTAVVTHGYLTTGEATVEADIIQPRIAAAGDQLRIEFRISPPASPLAHSISEVMNRGGETELQVMYRDVVGQRAWRYRGGFVCVSSHPRGRDESDSYWVLRDVDVEDVAT